MILTDDVCGIHRESVKSHRHIQHIRSLSKVRFPFTTAIPKPKWPEDLWNAGQLIYSVSEPENCLPPKTARGDKILRFDSKFESGNLKSAYHLGEHTYHLILEYDCNKSGSCQWFYFEIQNVRKDINYQFYISGFHKPGGVFCSGCKVFMYSTMNAAKNAIGWVRAGNMYGYGVTSQENNKRRSSLQFQIKFPFDNDTVYLSYALPYTYTDLRNDVALWGHSPKVEVENMCQTFGKRDCPILTITNPGSMRSVDEKPCIFLLGRIHPGESNSSFVLKGLIEFLLSSHPAARFLLDHYIVKVVPMVCIDGVIEGFYRCSLTGYDLNRVWPDPSPVLHPEVWYVKDVLRTVTMERKLEVYIDFHGHSYLHGTFAYGCPNDDNPTLAGVEQVFPRIISLISDAFSFDRCVFSYPDARKSASRIVVKREFGVVQCFTIESSFGGVTSGPMSGVLYDERIWLDLGSKIGEGLYHLLNPRQTSVRAFIEKGMSESQSRGDVFPARGLASPKRQKPSDRAKGVVKRAPVPVAAYVKRIPHVVKVRIV